MTFKQVVLKNFTKKLKSYLSFYLCSCFCVTVFFMYVAIIFNDRLVSDKNHDVFSYVLPISIVAISLFSIFFINYAHSTFIKSRGKEFGVYMSLGMNAKELKNLVLFEDILIAVSSIISGMLVGSLFSRLFQMILVSLLEVKGIGFTLDFRSFNATIIVFLLIFFVNFILVAKKISRSDILTLLTEARKGQKKPGSIKNGILGCVGLFLLIISFVYLVAIAKHNELNTNPLILLSYMLLAFLGVYLSIAEGGNFVLSRIRKSRFYYSNLLIVTQLQHKYNQNKKIMFILAILSTMILFFVASPFSLLNLCETIAQDNRSHLEFIVEDGGNDNYQEILNRYLPKEEVKEQIEVSALLVKINVDGEEISVPVLDVDTYNQCMNTAFCVPKECIANVILDWRPSDGGYVPGDSYTFHYQDKSYSYEVANSTNGKFIATSYGNTNLLLLNTKDYLKLESSAMSGDGLRFHVINFYDWKTTKDIVINLEESLKLDGYKAASVASGYIGLKQSYSVFLFTFSIMGVLFFIAGGVVLYFRQFAELPETKKIFDQLFKIGISFKETKSILSKQLFIIFYVPVAFGSYLGLSLIYLMTHLMGGGYIIKEFMTNALYVVIFYFASQCIFYLLTRRKYLNVIGTHCQQGNQ